MLIKILINIIYKMGNIKNVNQNLCYIMTRGYLHDSVIRYPKQNIVLICNVYIITFQYTQIMYAA